MQIIPEEEDAKFNMAPMIDMVFLLLVFFMVASNLSAKNSLPMNIPEATHGVIPKDRPDRWIVNITRLKPGDDWTVYSGESPVDDLQVLTDLVKERLELQPKLSVYLRADRDAPHLEVKKVMAAMARAGLDNFIFGVYTHDAEVEE